MRTLSSIAALTALLAAACQLADPIAEPQQEARLVFGEHIDGVRLGDDTTRVIQKLGRPDAVALGDFPGVEYAYTTGAHAGLRVAIWTDTGEGVQLIEAASPYSGTTAEGVRIGSARDAVLRRVGQPDHSIEGASAGSVVDRYFFGMQTLALGYADGEVERIVMSPLLSRD